MQKRGWRSVMKQELTTNQKGSIHALCMILSILIVIGLKEYWSYLLAVYDIKILIVICAACGFFVLSTTLIGMYSVLSGEKSPRQMKKIILKEKIKLNEILKTTRQKISALEKNIKYTSNIMNPKGFEELSTLRGLVASLESRVARVTQLLDTHDEDDIYRAYNTMFDQVSVYGNSLVGLITTEDNTTIFSYDHIQKEFDERLNRIMHHLPCESKTRRVRTATA